MIAVVRRWLLGYMCLAVLLGVGLYALAPATLFVGRDHSRPIAHSYGGMHREELYLATREIVAHQGDAAWLRAHDERWAPPRERVRAERLAYARGWLLMTGAGLAPLIVGAGLAARRRRVQS